MSSNNIKGQEVEIAILVDGQPSDSLQACKSFEAAFKTEILQEGFLGETTDRYDSIFKGIRGKAEFHYDSPGVFNLIKSIIDKARRRTPGLRINIKATWNFPNGRRARVVIRDAEFGELPLSFGSRSDYGTFSLDFAASEAQVLPA